MKIGDFDGKALPHKFLVAGRFGKMIEPDGRIINLKRAQDLKVSKTICTTLSGLPIYKLSRDQYLGFLYKLVQEIDDLGIQRLPFKFGEKHKDTCKRFWEARRLYTNEIRRLAYM